jgi:peptidoglycan hydrolase CwlO-like protein
MKEKITAIQTKVEELVDRLEKLKTANKDLSAENGSLKKELNTLKKQLKSTELGSNDTTEAVRRKLTSVLDRLGELESMVN